MEIVVNERDFGRLEAEVESLRGELKEHKESSQRNFMALSSKMDEIVALANQGRGSLRTLIFAAGAGGALVGWFADFFLRR
jgi:hypothetical protein